MYTYLQQALTRVLIHRTQVVKKKWKLVASFIIVYFQNAFFFFERTHTKLLKVLRFKKHSSNLGDFTHERQFLIKFIAAAVSLRFDEL